MARVGDRGAAAGDRHAAHDRGRRAVRHAGDGALARRRDRARARRSRRRTRCWRATSASARRATRRSASPTSPSRARPGSTTGWRSRSCCSASSWRRGPAAGSPSGSSPTSCTRSSSASRWAPCSATGSGRSRAAARPPPAVSELRRLAGDPRGPRPLRGDGAASGLGFVAAFVGGVAFRRYEHGHEYNRPRPRRAETVEKFGELALILLLGSTLTLSGLGSRAGLAGCSCRCCWSRSGRCRRARAARLAAAGRRPPLRRLVRRARRRVAVLRRGGDRPRRAVRRRGEGPVLDDRGVRRRVRRWRTA